MQGIDGVIDQQDAGGRLYVCTPLLLREGSGEGLGVFVLLVLKLDALLFFFRPSPGLSPRGRGVRAFASGRLLSITGLIVCLLFTAGCPGEKPPAQQGTQAVPVTRAEESTTQQVTIKSETFTLELALDDASRLQGLSDRAEIAEDGGMLFVFPREEKREFVMRRCLVPPRARWCGCTRCRSSATRICRNTGLNATAVTTRPSAPSS